MLFYDPTFLLLIPAIVLAIYANMKVKSAYAEMSRVRSSKGYTGADMARSILNGGGLNDVKVEQIPGELTDHYDPRSKILRLSSGVYSSLSIAATGIVAHEVGHALQDAKAYAPLKIRNNFVPVASFGSGLAFPLFFIGLIFANPLLMDLGIIAFSLAVAFHIITLPVEFDASSRAVKLLTQGGYVTEEEVIKVKKVLTAAALTYVAATAMAVLNLLRLLILRGRRN